MPPLRHTRLGVCIALMMSIRYTTATGQRCAVEPPRDHLKCKARVIAYGRSDHKEA